MDALRLALAILGASVAVCADVVGCWELEVAAGCPKDPNMEEPVGAPEVGAAAADEEGASAEVADAFSGGFVALANRFVVGAAVEAAVVAALALEVPKEKPPDAGAAD